MRNHLSTIAGFAVLVVILTAGAAQSLSGSNTVYTDDIVAGQVKGSDIGANAVTGAKIYPNTITGADVSESSLSLHKTYFQQVSSAGADLGGDATSVSKKGTGIYDVTFPSSIADCAATAGSANFANPTVGNTFYSRGYATVSVSIGNPSIATVATSVNNAAVDTSFAVHVICP